MLPRSLCACNAASAGNKNLDCFIKQANIFIQRKNSTGYLLCIFTIFKLHQPQSKCQLLLNKAYL
jgi:hypothetical protein